MVNPFFTSQKRRLFVSATLISVFLITTSLVAQQAKQAKYPSLLWEITGGGLSKPSYLFGTMHVSSKMAFHLGDAFYQSLETADVVALEIDPANWQANMVQIDRIAREYRRFMQPKQPTVKALESLQFTTFESLIAYALRSQPRVINGLLFRTSTRDGDFEEDTYLDLYIYQTGRRLGKQCTGLENYLVSERLQMEANYDMFYDRKKKKNRDVVFSQSELSEAYRKGDLDKLDSITKKATVSEAYEDKFLYKRNDIQAAAMDSILKTGKSLFAGVGAAHLPGSKGVIELLRKRGYTLKPIMMQDRDAQKKDSYDKIRVPVTYKPYQSEDSVYSLNLPEELYSISSESSLLNRKQSADMSNGVYVDVTRIPTYASLFGTSQSEVMRKIDSMLYENIPGKILTKTPITRYGIQGIDVVNRTRRGDVNRYHIYVTRFEVIIIRMSGTGEYVLSGDEPEAFFKSITLNPRGVGVATRSDSWTTVDASDYGCSFSMPGTPQFYMNPGTSDLDDRPEYSFTDTSGNGSYSMMRSESYGAPILENDTIELLRVHSALYSSDPVARCLKTRFGSKDAYPFIESSYKLNDSSVLHSRSYLAGNFVYTMLATGKSGNFKPDKYFESFTAVTPKVPELTDYADGYGKFRLKTPFMPKQDSILTPMYRKMDIISRFSGYVTPVPEQHRSTYEGDYFRYQFMDKRNWDRVQISYSKLGKYNSFTDSAHFWKWVKNYITKSKVIISEQPVVVRNGHAKYELIIGDTNSSRQLKLVYYQIGQRYYSIMIPFCVQRGIPQWTDELLASFTPIEVSQEPSMFRNVFPEYKQDFTSSDTDISAIARDKVYSMQITSDNISSFVDLISKMSSKEKDYFTLKQKMIRAIGYTKDTLNKSVFVTSLQRLYDQVSDTSLFQQRVLIALSRLRTQEAYTLLKSTLIQDPPDLSSERQSELFSNISDSLQLSTTLFPDLLQLAAIDSYKSRVLSLLEAMVDSGYIQPEAYETYYSRLIFDARFALKKVQAADEKESEQELRNANTARGGNNEDSYDYSYSYSYTDRTGLVQFASLLIPFYDKQAGVRKFFDKLVGSKSPMFSMMALNALLKGGKQVPDSIVKAIAGKELYRGSLYRLLHRRNKLPMYPKEYADQREIAKSVLIGENVSGTPATSNLDTIIYLQRDIMHLRNATGYVYFFKYRKKRSEKWNVAYVGVLPKDQHSIQADTVVTDDCWTNIKEQRTHLIPKFIELEKIELVINSWSERKRSNSSYEFDTED